jgi:PTS system nitrogen regulatory IIA component
MELTELLTPESIVSNLKVTSKKQVLQELSKRIAKIIDCDERFIVDVLLEREKLGTTGVGDGIAIPHGKLGSLKKLHGFFARLERPVDFDSVDERPVDLIFFVAGT